LIEAFENAKQVAEEWDARRVLAWGFACYRQQIAIASSFGLEDVVLIDMARSITPAVDVFTLDTGFLFPETYDLIGRIESRYGVVVERIQPDLSPAGQAEKHGPSLWQRDPDLCCRIRKVEPLRRKLGTLKAWITGIRRAQSPTRASARKVEWDETFGLVKLNPLADWTTEGLWDYIRAYEVPYNPLHEHNYPSIGCTHCTRPVQPGEHPRAGRWSGFRKTECGLHTLGTKES
jgi:phosphoadenosine phosphosulfate reductase